MMVAQAAKSHKVREVVLHVVFYSLGIILFIFTAFIALISGLLAIVQNTNLRNHWNYYRTSISELFNGIESDINSIRLHAGILREPFQSHDSQQL